MNWIQNKSAVLRGLPREKRYLIGVSGGRDSVALLHYLVDLGYQKLIVCHFNHQLRGRSSDADARFVERLIANYNAKTVGQALRLPSRAGKRSARPTMRLGHLEFALGSANVRTLAKERKMSIEAAGREARYSFFARIAKRRRCRTIFLGHHADDLVETFLINLFRGAGTSGLAAMREISTRRVDDVDLTIVRPLLGIWRTDIDRYIRVHRLKFREDASNKSLGPLRNRFRRKIIPYLEKEVGRNIRQNIWRTATILAEEESWIDNQLPYGNEIDLPVEKLRALTVAVQRRRILGWLRAHNIPNVSFEIVERVRSLLDRDGGVAKVNLPQDRHARRRAKRIFITR